MSVAAGRAPHDEPVVYLGGRLIPQSQAHVAIYDFGIVLGATVTDLVRTFRQEPYRLEDHVRRFYESCKYARITPPVNAAETIGVTQELIRRNAALIPADRELAIVLFITPGEQWIYAGSAAAGPGAGAEMKPTFCIHSFPLPFHVWRHLFTDGAHLVTPPTRHVPPECVDPKTKNRSRLHWWIADQETRLVDPRAISVLLDLQGNLTETSGANLLLVKDGAILSPTPRNILLGISRQTVIELAARLGLPFLERDLQVHDAVNAGEILLATTPYCLAPVTRFNGLPIGDGRPGPVFRRLIAAWSEQVGVDILAQNLAEPTA